MNTAQPQELNISKDGSPLERGLSIVAGRLREGESVQWSQEPSKKLLLLDLGYRATLWWTIFPCVVPMTEATLAATALIMVLLARLEYKQRSSRNFYVITSERAMLGTFTRNGDLKYIDECELKTLIAVKKSPFTRTVKIKYKRNGRVLWLRFPYVGDAASAIQLLQGDQTSPLR